MLKLHAWIGMAPWTQIDLFQFLSAFQTLHLCNWNTRTKSSMCFKLFWNALWKLNQKMRSDLVTYSRTPDCDCAELECLHRFLCEWDLLKTDKLVETKLKRRKLAVDSSYWMGRRVTHSWKNYRALWEGKVRALTAPVSPSSVSFGSPAHTPSSLWGHSCIWVQVLAHGPCWVVLRVWCVQPWASWPCLDGLTFWLSTSDLCGNQWALGWPRPDLLCSSWFRLRPCLAVSLGSHLALPCKDSACFLK